MKKNKSVAVVLILMIIICHLLVTFFKVNTDYFKYKYKKFDVVYADFGRNPHGVQGGIRPGIVVSCDASNHGGAPQISVVPLSSKLKDNPVHVIVEPSEIRGHALSNRSDFMPEDIQTLNKGCVRFKSGYIPGESEIREAMDRAMIMQLNLLPVARKMVLEELEMKQNG